MQEDVLKSVNRIESELSGDPRREKVGGQEGPRDLLFTRRVVSWIKKLQENPSEALLLAAWGHVLYRWRLPRDKYPKTTMGYHHWRNEQARISAGETEKILMDEGIDGSIAEKVRALILKSRFPADPDSQVLEDASCLAFFELKLKNYLSEWDQPKTLRILKGTLEKMSPKARSLLLTFSLPAEAAPLLENTMKEIEGQV